MTASPSPSALLAAADAMLGSAAAASLGVHHRATAFLLRMALEKALERYWAQVCPDVNRCRTRMRSVCLDFYGRPGLSGRWSACWNALSRACHYHGYTFAPTAAELRRWREETAAILEALSAPSRRGTPAQ